jgi:hypothetical protein
MVTLLQISSMDEEVPYASGNGKENIVTVAALDDEIEIDIGGLPLIVLDAPGAVHLAIAAGMRSFLEACHIHGLNTSRADAHIPEWINCHPALQASFWHGWQSAADADTRLFVSIEKWAFQNGIKYAAISAERSRV